jgi:hypothetical protein
MPTQDTEDLDGLAARMATVMIVPPAVGAVVTGLVLLGFGSYAAGGMTVFLGIMLLLTYAFIVGPRFLARRRRSRS